MILSSPSIGDSLSSFYHYDLSGSDHIPQLIELTNLPEKNYSYPPKWNFKKANWTKYQELCSKSPNIDMEKSIDVIIEGFCNHLLDSASQSIPKSISKIRRLVPWWNNDCAIALKNRKSALKLLKQNGTSENLLNYRRLRAKAQWTLKQAKRKSWQDFLSKLQSNTPTSKIWSSIRRLSPKKVASSPINILIDGKIQDDPKTIAEAFATYLSYISSDESQEHEFVEFKTNNEPPLCFHEPNTHPINSDITLNELETAIQQANESAPGPDLIYNQFLKKAPPNITLLLLKIFNHIWKTHSYPKSWNTAIVIPFQKPNKNPFQIENYRPISLTSNICKIFEKIVNKRLIWTLEKEHKLSPFQCGFRPSRSTINQLTYITSHIKAALNNKNHLLALFFDMNKAFDTIWKYKIISKLHSWNIKGNLLHFIQNFLTNRNFVVRIANTISEKYPLINGVPQGAVLSPTLFNIAIDDLLSVMPPFVLKALFADDLSVFIECNDPITGETLLQQAADNIHNWSLKNGLSISSQKSTAIHFCKKYKCSRTLSINMNNNQIPSKNTIKYLGITFDNKLTWTPHIQNLKKNCSIKINLLKKLAHTNYGSDKTILLKIYRTLIRSKLDYGSSLYASASISTLNSLNTIHNSSIRIALGAFRTTPTTSLLSEASEPPLDIRRQHVSAISTLNILSNPNSPTITQITHTFERFHPHLFSLLQSITSNNTLIAHYTTNLTPPWLESNINIDLSLTVFDKQETNSIIFNSHFNEILNKYPNHQKIFTDGSKRNNQTACALVHNENQILIPLPPEYSILSAELYALKMAINYTLELSANKAIIFTDSLSALHSIQNYHTAKQNPLAQEIAKSIINSLNDVILCWIPSHRNITHNETADHCAKLALDITPIQNTPIPLSDLKKTIKLHSKSIFQQYWEQIPLTNKLKRIKNNINPRNSFNSISRRDDIIITRLRTGHTLLTHSYLLNKATPPICDFCNIQITTEHILLQCPKYQNERIQHLHSNDLREILSDDEQQIQNTIKFLTTSRLRPLI